MGSVNWKIKGDKRIDPPKESVEGKFVVVSVGRIFDDKKTLRQKLGKMNCEKLFDNLVKTISKRRKINSSRLTQTGHSNQKEGHRLIEKMILPPCDLKKNLKEELLAYCQQFFPVKSIIDDRDHKIKNFKFLNTSFGEVEKVAGKSSKNRRNMDLTKNVLPKEPSSTPSQLDTNWLQ